MSEHADHYWLCDLCGSKSPANDSRLAAAHRTLQAGWFLIISDWDTTDRDWHICRDCAEQHGRDEWALRRAVLAK